MSSKNQTHSVRLDEFSSRLSELNLVVKLCAFAAEARRALGDIEILADTNPVFQEIMQRRIETPTEWAVHDDVVGVVLKSVSLEIDQLTEQLVLED
jgi:hypothetical protein